MALIGNPLMPFHPPQDPLALIRAIAARRVDPPVGQGLPAPLPFGPHTEPGEETAQYPHGPFAPPAQDPLERIKELLGHPGTVHAHELAGAGDYTGAAGLWFQRHPEAVREGHIPDFVRRGEHDLVERLPHDGTMETDPLAGFHSRFLQPADRVEGLASALRGSHHSYQEPRSRRSALASAAGGAPMRAS